MPENPITSTDEGVSSLFELILLTIITPVLFWILVVLFRVAEAVVPDSNSASSVFCTKSAVGT